MSSNLSVTDVHPISHKRLFAPHSMEDKSQRLVRTSSLEKIRRFNTYICSQNYYILPALLAWLKSSQSVLQASTERTIFCFRSLLFTNFLYKLYQSEFKALMANLVIFALKQVQTCRLNALRMAVYLTGTLLAGQLGLCVYMLSETKVPGGLVFLIICWLYIVHLQARSTFFMSKNKTGETFKKKN